MRHIHRRNVCDHGYEGKPCHPGNHKDVGHAACADTDCPTTDMQRHVYEPHKSGINCVCGITRYDRVHF